MIHNVPYLLGYVFWEMWTELDFFRGKFKGTYGLLFCSTFENFILFPL